MSTPWHLDQQLAERYADGALGDVLVASVEQHLLGCAACRTLLTPHVETPRLDAVWAEVLEEVERPRPTLLERCLHGLGVGDATARLVATTPALRGAWLAGSLLVLLLALLSAYVDPHGVAVYLAVTPLLPMVGVALVYGPRADPAHEIVAATPYSSLRLLALRTAFVVAGTIVPATVAGLLLPVSTYVAGAWLLPALALTVGTVALSTRVSPHLAAAGLGGAWLLVALRGLAPRQDPLLALHTPVMLLCLVGLAAGAAVLAHRRRDLAELVRRTS
jgi:hypothetical protein